MSSNSSGNELTVLLRHLPRIVVSRFMNKPERPRGPESRSFLAAVALFDISGFSSLGSRLSEDERRRSRKSGSGTNGNNNSSNNTVVPSSASAATVAQATGYRPPLTTSATSSRLLSPIKAKSRISQSSLPSWPGFGRDSSAAESVNSSTRRDTVRRQESVSKFEDSDSLGEDEEDVSPSDIMRQRRQSSVSHSSSTMSFMHGPKSGAVAQGIAVETLTTALNKSLEPVIDVILKHGGDIIKFAGDALIVIWETEASQGKSTSAGELVYRAVCCALEALRALESAVAASHHNENEEAHLKLLGMHVGIGVSKMTGNHVGGVLNRWEFYLSGDANRQMSFAEENAQKGQLALSPEAHDALEDRFGTLPELIVTNHHSGNYLIQELPGDASAIGEGRHKVLPSVREASAELLGCLRSYVPGAIVSILQKGLTLTPCRLNITVAFVKLEGVVEIKNPQTQLQTIHQTLCTIQECAYKAQGTLRQFVIDDKGAIAIVAIGLAPFFHENNAFRGVKFSCYVVESGIKASIGVTTGSAFCGSVGSSARAEYAVVGDSINLAARLMAAAPVGDIYCDERTRKETKDSVHFRDMIELTVKGKTEAIEVFPVQLLPELSDGSTPTWETTCPAPYGCSEVLNAVPLFASTTKNGDSGGGDARGLVVCGDSGTGKTMLLNHVIQRQSIRSFKGSGDSMDTAADFHAWRSIARTMAMVKVKPGTHKMSLSSGDGLSSRESFSNLVSSVTSDLGRSSSLTGHRPSQHGRPSRTSTLTTHEESGSDHEMNANSSLSAELASDIDVNRPFPADNPAPTSQRISILDHLVLNQQVTKTTLWTLRDWFPSDGARTSSAGIEKSEQNAKSIRHVLFSIMAVISAVKPIMLVFDDAQWMDNRSLSLVLKVLEELPNVYFLLAVRGMSEHCASARSMLLALVMSLPSVTTRQMNCFSYQVTSLFLCQYYHITIMDTQVLGFVYERTEGNPAALIKLLNFMLEANYIAIEPEHNNIVILRDLDEMDTIVPQHIRARVMSIVDSVDALAQAALKLLSINPQPSEEKMVNGVLTLFSASSQDASANGEVNGIRLKLPRPTSELALLRQVRMSLVPCEKSLLTIDAHNKLYFFNTEEMRLVVYDTMLPSQRSILHGLYAEWLRNAAAKPMRDSIDSGEMPDLTRINSASSTRSMVSTAGNTKAIHPMPYQQYALLGYHLSQSDNPSEALEAYYLAAEGALEAKELGFAEDCMHTSNRILNSHHRIADLSELEMILLRCRIEFIRGAIAVESNDLTLAVTHMSYVTRLFSRKGSILRRYTSSVQREGMLSRSVASFSRRTSFPMSTVEINPVAPGCFGLLVESTAVDGIQSRCMPRLFTFNNIYPSVFRSSKRQGRSKTKKGKSAMLLTRLKSSRVQPEQTVEALDQINFYRRKASALIKQIHYSKKKEEEMHTHIRKFAQKSLQSKDKRRQLHGSLDV